jgi:esterase
VGQQVPSETRVVVGEVALVVKTWSAGAVRRAPVVLLPATGETADDWDVVAPALAASRTVHAVNLRGHGPSDWPGSYSIRLLAADVVGLLPQLAAGPVDLVAHSLGGLVACAVAAARPGLVGRLVLEDVGLLHPRPPGMPARPAGALAFDWRMVEQVRPEIDTPDPGWVDVVAAIEARTLVVGGGPSSHVPQEHVADLARTLRAGRLVTVHAGHLVHATRPHAFLQVLQAFLDVP